MAENPNPSPNQNGPLNDPSLEALAAELRISTQGLVFPPISFTDPNGIFRDAGFPFDPESAISGFFDQENDDMGREGLDSGLGFCSDDDYDSDSWLMFDDPDMSLDVPDVYMGLGGSERVDEGGNVGGEGFEVGVGNMIGVGNGEPWGDEFHEGVSVGGRRREVREGVRVDGLRV